MERFDPEFESSDTSLVWLPPFGVGIALVVLVLSLLYTMLFGYMVYVSLLEQVIAPLPHPPRYAPHIHYHNPVEWILLLAPVLLGLIGTAGSVIYLGRRWLSR